MELTKKPWGSEWGSYGEAHSEVSDNEVSELYKKSKVRIGVGSFYSFLNKKEKKKLWWNT